jgi:hypothetical protein
MGAMTSAASAGGKTPHRISPLPTEGMGPRRARGRMGSRLSLSRRGQRSKVGVCLTRTAFAPAGTLQCRETFSAALSNDPDDLHQVNNDHRAWAYALGQEAK